MKQRHFLLISLCASALSGFGCGAAPTVSLRMSGNIADASVTVDDQNVGSLHFVSKHGVALPRGSHRITVEKSGYFPFDQLVNAEGPPVMVEVSLEKIPD